MTNITWEEAVLWLREQPDQQELVRACYYDDPLIGAAQRYECSDEWLFTLHILPKIQNGLALDLGAGRGISSYALAKAGWHVDALEPDPSRIVGRGAIEQIATECKFPIRALDGFAESIPMQSGVCDLVYGRQVMHHANDLQKMCAEIARVLKPGGVFVATREHVISKRDDLAVFLKNHPLHSLYGGENAFMLNEYLNAISMAGLKVKDTLGPMDTPINYFPMTIGEREKIIQRPIVKWLGPAFSKILLSKSAPWGDFVNNSLASFYSRKDQSAGRLYTFIAIKP